MKTIQKNKKKIILFAVIFILAGPLIVMPIVTVSVYESIFGMRHETVSWMKFSTDDYEGLNVERNDFQSKGIKLAGYKYSKTTKDIKGVVIISHGLGGGGHISYMPFIDFFTSNGYYVFAYDACGNDNSEGKDVDGFPRGIIDLESAINHTKTIEEYKDKPIALFGHSWGGYSVGNVLGSHPEIKAAVIVAGFNESEDLLSHYGKKYGGSSTLIAMPYLQLYEKLKFGEEYTDISAIESMKKSNAAVMIVHSKDDTNVPIACGYDKFYNVFGNSDRFEFVLYENRGHSYLFYSEASEKYREQLNNEYSAYLNEIGKESTAEIKESFMNEHLNKKLCFEPDAILMDKILNLYDTYCAA